MGMKVAVDKWVFYGSSHHFGRCSIMTYCVSVEEIRPQAYSTGGLTSTTIRNLVVSWCSTELEWAASAACSVSTLRSQVTRHVRGYLGLLWRTGALRGKQPHDAFNVTCDGPTTSHPDIGQNSLVCRVGIAPAGSSGSVFLLIRIRLRSPSTPLAAA